MPYLPKALRNSTGMTHLTGAGNYSWLHYSDGRKEVFSGTLAFYEQSLPNFIRIHKTALINPGFLDFFELPDNKKNGFVTLKGGIVLPISRRRRLAVEAIELLDFATLDVNKTAFGTDQSTPISNVCLPPDSLSGQNGGTHRWYDIFH